jgi:hypothetical protein
MELIDKIKTIYPELTDNDFVHTIELCDESLGNGPFINIWNHPTLKRPTDEELEAIA